MSRERPNGHQRADPRDRPLRIPRSNGTVARERRVIAPELKTRAFLFVRFRWIVPPLIIITAGAASAVGFGFDFSAVIGVAGFTLVYNAVLQIVGKRIDRSPGRARRIYFFAYTQVCLDFTSVFVLTYLTGGVASPLIFYFIFHIVFASILLPARSAIVFTSIVVICMGLVVGGEITHALPHSGLAFRGDEISVSDKPWYLLTMLVFFSSAVFITAVSTTAIMRMLKHRILENAKVYHELERLTDERWRFMLKAAHNLRAPLTAIMSMVEVFRSNYLGPVNPAQQEHLRRIDRRTRTMAAMIDDLLVIAKRRAGKKTSPVFMPLGEVAGRITRTFEDEARRKGLSLVVEIPDDMRTVRADLEVLEPVLENLLSNAFKYTREGRVLVRFELAGNDLKFTVEDTGIGIPREDRPKLFTEFFRAKNAKAVEEIGNGLGLALVKQTLNQHHGRIEVESEEGRGTRFVVFLTFQIG